MDAERRRPRPPVSACAVHVSGLVATELEGERGSAGSLVGAAAGGQPHAAAAGRGDRGAAQAALHGGGDRGDAGHGAVDGVGDPDAARAGPAGAARARAAVSATSLAAGRARCTSMSRQLGRIEGGAGNARAAGVGATHRAPAPTRRASSASTIGWEYVHVCVDDYSRLAYAEVLARREGRRRRSASCTAPSAFYRRHGITGRAGADRQRLRLPSRARTHSPAAGSGSAHSRTRPYRPQTNGKAERFIRTLLARLGLRRHLPLKQRTNSRP